MVVMTGQQVIDFIRQHKLKDAEVEIDNMDFTIDLPDDTWLEYDIEDEDVKRYPNPDEWQIGPDVISYEEAMNLRFPTELKKPRARMYTIVINGGYSLSCAQDIFEEFKRRFLPWCSKLGKGSIYKEQIKFVEMRTYYKISMFMTKRNFMQVLDQIDYDVSPGGGKTYYIFTSFKEEGEQNEDN